VGSYAIGSALELGYSDKNSAASWRGSTVDALKAMPYALIAKGAAAARASPKPRPPAAAANGAPPAAIEASAAVPKTAPENQAIRQHCTGY
jgi:hypothetical protein